MIFIGRCRYLTTVEGCSDILFDSQIAEIKNYKPMWVYSDLMKSFDNQSI